VPPGSNPKGNGEAGSSRILGANELAKGVFVCTPASAIGKLAPPPRETIRLYRKQGLIGNSRALHVVFKLIYYVAPTDTTVLLIGPPGVGKTLIARVIHLNSLRSKAEFVTVECTTLSPTMAEGELFGVVPRRATGVEGHPGLFDEAQGGTFFLDEFGDLEGQLQGKLLRASREKVIRRVGGATGIPIDTRIIAATNRRLYRAIRSHSFRLDLFQRIFVFPILVPPLSERRDDIPLLVHELIRRLCPNVHSNIIGIAPDALTFLMDQDLPGNIADLASITEVAMDFERSTIISLNSVMAACEQRAIARTWLSESDTEPATPQPMKARHVRGRVPSREAITAALDEANGIKADAAAKFGVVEHTFGNWMRKFSITRPDDEHPV
jgi:transcriptional regulator with GAF, ATPase, and Fis domain